MCHIILVADSRGAYLEKYLRENDVGLNYTKIVLPGATLDKLAVEAERTRLTLLKKYRNLDIYIIYIGGICSLTSRNYTPQGREILYNNRDNKQKVINFFNNQYKRNRKNLKIKAANIISMSLVDYQNNLVQKGKLKKPVTSIEDLLLQQEMLQNDVLEINNELKKLNEEFSTKAIRFDKIVFKSRFVTKGDNRKKVKQTIFDYNELYDGLHPIYEAVKRFFGYMFLGIKMEINAINDSGEEDIDKPTWDFKRPR